MTDQVTPSQRRTTVSGIAASAAVTVVLWYLLLRFLPEPANAEALPTALACCAIAGLFTLVMGVEAIAHERLVSPGIDPLAGFETRRMRVNFRYRTPSSSSSSSPSDCSLYRLTRRPGC